MKEKALKIIKSKYFIGTILTIILYLIYLAIAKIAPFGENSILKSDLYKQYAEFLAYYKDVLTGKGSLFMSWNMGMGNNFYTTFAYYLVSPLNLLVVFFSKENINTFVIITTLLKLILIYNSMIAFLEYRFKNKSRSAILFALAYTFSTYTIQYLFHIMWLDAIYMLPLMCIGIEKYLKNNKISTFIIISALNMLFNYYLGFITILFSGIYFIVRLVEQENITLKSKIIKFTVFVIGCIISFGISMILFLPSFMQVKGTMKLQNRLVEIHKKEFLNYFNIIFNNHNQELEQQSGLIFSSTLTLILLPLYFTNKNINKKSKILSALLIIFMALPVISPILNKIWHGMTTPNCFYYRYAFCLIFYINMIAYQDFINREKISKKSLLIETAVFLLILLGEIILINHGTWKNRNLQINLAIISSMVVISTIILLFLQKSDKIRNKISKYIIKSITIVIFVIDIGISMNSYNTTNPDNYFTLKSVHNYDNVINRILPPETDRHQERIIFNPDDNSFNLSMKYDYSSIDYFTSSRNRTTLRNMYSLGYNVQRETALWITSDSGDWFNYSLAGVKYIITRENLDNDNKIYGYEYKGKYGEFNIYETQNTLPYAYIVNSNQQPEEIDAPFYEQTKNPFEIQNKILKSIQNSDEDYIENIKNEQSKIIKSEKNIVKTDKEYEITYNVEALQNISIALFSDSNLELYKNDKKIFKDYSNIWERETGIRQIVNLEKGQKYTFKITQKIEKYDSNNDNIKIYVLNNNKIEKAIEHAKKIQTQKVTLEKDTIKANIQSDKEAYLTFQIPFDSGWRATINGQNTEIVKMNGAFLGIKLQKGNNEIKLKYIPRYFKISALLSLINLILLLIIICLEKRKSNII